MATESVDIERTDQLMAAARPVSALAARVGHDREFSGQLVKAAHAENTAEIERLMKSAGVAGTVSIERAAKAGQRTVISIHLDVGPIHVSIDVTKSTK